jgi:uncharacterized protein (UPF0333 family)
MEIRNKKGQVSIEIIILIGVLLVVAILLAVIFLDFSNKSIQSTTDTVEGTEDVTDDFIKDFNTTVNVIYVSQDSMHKIVSLK